MSAQDNPKKVIEELLGKMIAERALDLHLTVGLPPTIRVSGTLRPIVGTNPLTHKDIEDYLYSIIEQNKKEELKTNLEMDTSYSYKDAGRFRINAFFQRGSLSAAFRLVPMHIPTLEELNLPHLLYEFCKLPQGLILLTGSTGMGKSTTIAAMLNWINQNRNAHVITIEDPIEFMFESNKALIQQREMGIDTLTWPHAIRSVLRQDCNVIVVGEMRDYETISATLTAAETGHLVLATLHTNSAAQSIDRIVDVFPENQQEQVRTQLAAVLEGIVSQVLVNGINTEVRYPATEILIANTAVKNSIREGNIHLIDNIIATSSDIGMISMERSLANLVTAGSIELEEAQTRSLKPNEIVRLVKSQK